MRALHTVAVVLAGGVGSRLGLDVPEQMVKIAGKTILEHTIECVHDCTGVDEVVLMMAQGWTEQAATLLGNRYPKLTRILEGGSTRNESTRRVLDALGDDDCKVLLHDAVRPLLDERIVRACIAALDTYDAVDVVIPSSDTIVEVDDDGVITAIPERSRLRRGQTPQAFRLGVLRDAYRRAADDPDFQASDDCGVVLRYRPDVPIATVDGAEHNLKVTHPVHLFIADKLFQLATRTVPATDSAERHKVLQGRTVLVLGGSYGIGAEIAGWPARPGRTSSRTAVPRQACTCRSPRSSRRRSPVRTRTMGGSMPWCWPPVCCGSGGSPTCPRTRSPRRWR